MSSPLVVGERVWLLRVPGRPVAYARAGSHGKRRYTIDRVERYMQAIAWEARRARIRLGDAPLSVRIVLVSSSRLRGDIDNYTKSVLDGLTKGEAYTDDAVVVRLVVELERCDDPAEEETVIYLTRHRSPHD